MTLSPQTIIFVVIMILIVGFAAGWMAGGTRTGEEKRNQDAPPGGRRGAYVPLVKLWRERTGTRLVIEFDEKAYISRDVLQPAQLLRLRRLVADFSAWTGLSGLVADTPPVASTPVAEMPAGVSLAPILEQPASTSLAAPAPIARPMTNLAAQPPQPPVPPAPAVPEAPKSITGQIDEILQEMLAGTPMESRGIRLAENLRSGVVVWVGKENFDGISAVPYPEVSDAIRKAVKEWEKRAG